MHFTAVTPNVRRISMKRMRRLRAAGITKYATNDCRQGLPVGCNQHTQQFAAGRLRRARGCGAPMNRRPFAAVGRRDGPSARRPAFPQIIRHRCGRACTTRTARSTSATSTAIHRTTQAIPTRSRRSRFSDRYESPEHECFITTPITRPRMFEAADTPKTRSNLIAETQTGPSACADCVPAKLDVRLILPASETWRERFARINSAIPLP